MYGQPDGRTLRLTTQALIVIAGAYKRQVNAVRNGAALITEGRCEFVDEQTIRIYSNSGETYLTSLTDCVNEGTKETCPAFAVGVPCKHRAALHILRKINEGDADGEHECSDCHRRYHLARLNPVDKTALAPGDVVPSGECPFCGFNCYPRAAA
jgi:hypothetical protein